MKLIILEISSNNYRALESHIKIIQNANKILSLTPSACYFLESNSIEFISFHNIVSIVDFRDKIISMYEKMFKENQDVSVRGLFIVIAKYLNQFLFIEFIIDYMNSNCFESVVYITDKELSKNVDKISNSESFLYNYINFNQIITISKTTQKKKRKKLTILKKYSFKQIFTKLIHKLSHNKLNYDWSLINPNVKFYKIFTQKKTISFKLSKLNFKYVTQKSLDFHINSHSSKVVNFFTFLDEITFFQALELLRQNKRLFFFQHGSYLYQNIFIKYSEIEPASANFVFNNYTEKVFKELGAKKVYSVGSINFNQTMKKRKIEYDFLYITQGHDYMGNLQYVDFPNSLHSFDGYELYQRHKNIIKLFGEQFQDKKIIIRVHPGVVSTGIYVPFWELSKPYPNITINVSIPIHTLIEKSKYIISDYFTTEFINRELHYKRDIILFQGAPTPLPGETLEDMKKMFILVETVDDLKAKVENIEEISQNRKRYDDIIEYYSSKKCDTKKIVTEILENELYGR